MLCHQSFRRKPIVTPSGLPKKVPSAAAEGYLEEEDSWLLFVDYDGSVFCLFPLEISVFAHQIQDNSECCFLLVD
jgi:hypothetical protein